MGLEKCARSIWMDDRWCLPAISDGRKQMIFRLGDGVEDILHKALPKAFVVTNGPEQIGGKFISGHVRWHADDLLYWDDCYRLAEYKSANSRRFNRLKKLGSYKQWDNGYWCQIQGYMGAINEQHDYDVEECVVIVVNKNDCEIYEEIVPFDKAAYEEIMERAEWLVKLESPPPPTMTASDYRVKNFMDEDDQGVYLGHLTPKQINCRNCHFSRRDFNDDDLKRGRWGCKKHRKVLTFDEQKTGCNDHEWIPELVPATLIDEDEMIYQRDDEQFQNGPDHIPSDRMAWLCRNGWVQDEALEIAEAFSGKVEIL